jgi:hypothetical protein
MALQAASDLFFVASSSRQKSNLALPRKPESPDTNISDSAEKDQAEIDVIQSLRSMFSAFEGMIQDEWAKLRKEFDEQRNDKAEVYHDDNERDLRTRHDDTQTISTLGMSMATKGREGDKQDGSLPAPIPSFIQFVYQIKGNPT